MLSQQDRDEVIDAVYAVINDSVWRPRLPFNITRLKQQAVQFGFITEAIAADPDADGVVIGALNEIIETAITNNLVPPIAPAGSVANVDRWAFQ